MSLLQFVNNVGETVERGDVVVIASRQPGIQNESQGMPTLEVDLAQEAYDTAVCGVVYDLYAEHKTEPSPEAETEKGGGKAGKGAKRAPASAPPNQAFTMEELASLDRSKVAPGQIGHLVTGGVCVTCKVDADIAPIKAGDLLTTSVTKGHAQKVTEHDKAAGAVLGKALGSLKKGKGTIPVLITLH